MLTNTKLINSNITRPILPPLLKVLLNNNNRSKYFYNILTHQYQNTRLINKWNQVLTSDIDEKEWRMIHKICFNTIKRKDFVWLQYRVIHRILGTKSYLNKIGISNSATCTFCNSYPETLCHLFVACPLVSEFWQNITTWLQTNFGIYLTLSENTAIFGILEYGFDFFPKNLIILAVKKYIWMCSRKSKQLHLTDFQNYFRTIYIEQEYMSKINNETDKFQALWSVFRNIL